jgi:hypothetical protein
MATKVWFGPGAYLGIYDYSKRSHPNLLMGESKDKGVLLLTCNKCPCGSYRPKEKEEGGSGWSWTVIRDGSGSDDDDGWSWGENEGKSETSQWEARVLGTFVVNGANEEMAGRQWRLPLSRPAWPATVEPTSSARPIRSAAIEPPVAAGISADNVSAGSAPAHGLRASGIAVGRADRVASSVSEYLLLYGVLGNTAGLQGLLREHRLAVLIWEKYV